MAKILLVEDDLDLAGRIIEWLQFEKHAVESVTDGREASDLVKFYKYELLILDWNLPGKSGLEICKEHRAAGGTTPVLILTGRGEIEEKEAGLDSGADDYLTKPFHMKELSARVRALLRRASRVQQTVIQVGSLELDTNSHTVTQEGKELQLLPKEFALLEFFMRHPDEVFSPEALLDRIWSTSSESSTDTIYTYIKTLRKKIAKDGEKSPIRTVHGIGYKLITSE